MHAISRMRRWWSPANGATLVLAMTVMAPSLHRPPAHAAVDAEAASGAPEFVAVEGRFVRVVTDDFERGRSETFLAFQTAAGRMLRVDAAIASAGLEGRRGEMRGEVLEGVLAADFEFRESPDAAPRTARPAERSGEARAIVLVGNLKDQNVACSVATAANLFWGPGASAASLWKEASRGALTFPSDSDDDGKPDIFGPFKIPFSKAKCLPDDWSKALDDAARAAGIDLDPYSYRTYLLPPVRACPFGGLGTVEWGDPPTPQSPAWALNLYCDIHVVAHEWGHNLGLWHASTDGNNDGTVDSGGEYGDQSSIMGSTTVLPNGPQKEQLDWLAPAVVSQAGTRTLALAPGAAGTSKLPRLLSLRNLYWVSYRQPTGLFEKWLPKEFTRGVSVHRAHRYAPPPYRPPWPPFAGRCWDCSYPNHRTLLVKTLQDGATWSDARGIRVRQTGHTKAGATVEVTLPAPKPWLFKKLAPCALLDMTTGGHAAMLDGRPEIWEVAGRCGVPKKARAVQLEVAVVTTDEQGWNEPGTLTLGPANLAFDDAPAEFASIAFPRGPSTLPASNVTIGLSEDGFGALGAAIRCDCAPDTRSGAYAIVRVVGYSL